MVVPEKAARFTLWRQLFLFADNGEQESMQYVSSRLDHHFGEPARYFVVIYGVLNPFL